jgi:hypothetical protein
MTAIETNTIRIPIANDYDPGGDIGRRVFFDIETAPLREVKQFADWDMEPPKNYKKKETISEWHKTAVEKQLEKSALDPDLCRVVAIGWRLEDGALESCVAKTASEEKDAIERFWAAVGRGCVVGYNCIGFDLPVLLRRSMYLGIRKGIPHFYLSKYRPSANIIDVMVRLSMDGLLPYRSLNWYARRCGLRSGIPTIGGRDIPMLVESDQWDLVQRHVEEDVQLLRELALHCHFAD